ncbi:MAG: PAS domain S-box protein [Myxococcota bacterium]
MTGSARVLDALLDTSQHDDYGRHRDAGSSVHAWLDILPLATVAIDRRGHTLVWNPAASRLLGWTPQEVLGAPRLTLDGSAPRHVALLCAALDEDHEYHGLELTLCRKDGSPIELMLWSQNLHRPDGTAAVAMGLLAELGERKQVERDYAHLFATAHDAILIFEPVHEVVLEANPRACEMYGLSRDELVGMSLRELSVDVPAGMARVKQTLKQQGVTQFQTWQHHKDGRRILLEVNASVTRFGGQTAILSINRDITHRAQLEQRVRQSERMEALGQMAAGVAHDFNNLLTAMMSYPELIRDNLPSDHEALPHLRAIQQAALRASKMTRHLLAFSRGQPLALQTCDLNEVVREALDVLRRLVREDVALDVQLHPAALAIRADASRLDQVLINLASNAQDAMPHGGRLELRTESVMVHTDTRGVEPGHYALLTVRDTGSGIPPELMAQVFDPFFTTKQPGLGTGLGLSTVYGIVEQHGGKVVLDSEIDQGTTFKLYFPLRDERVSVPTPGSIAPVTAGTGTLLLVEDDPVVRLLALASLERAGYQVLVAEDGTEAEQLFERQDVALLITDVLMPGIDGPTLFERLRSLRPALRCLFISGYDAQARVPPDASFLAKPFTPSSLTHKVRQVLAGE